MKISMPLIFFALSGMITSSFAQSSEIPILTYNPQSKKINKEFVSQQKYSLFLQKNLNRSLKGRKKLKSNRKYQLDFIVIALSGDARFGLFNFYASPSANFEFHMKVID